MFIGGDYVGHPSHIGRKCVFKWIEVLLDLTTFVIG